MADEDANNHPETSASTPNSSSAQQSANKAAKDRNCPFCGQAFTSSSLGRHLDLYIKPKNPKPPDGIHDVEEIKKLRGGITRRQPRTGAKSGNVSGNGGPSRQESHGHGTPNSAPGRPSGTIIHDDSPVNSPVNAKDNNDAHTFFNRAHWQATGVINNLPPRAPSRGSGESPQPHPGQAQRVQQMRRDDTGTRIERPQYEGESMWKLQEAAELGRAAEMALREILGSVEAASKKLEPKLLFEEFDFYSLSFPGLCLAILPAPTTLFSPTPFPSGESWTLTPPGKRQWETMVRFLNERSVMRRKTENIPDSVLFRHHTHLSGAWEHWEAMSESDRASAWQLEILRSYTRAQERNRSYKTELEQAQQHIRHLEAEYDRLSRCQLPREFLTHPPNTVPISSAVMRELRTSRLQSGADEVNYDAGALITKWRSQIKNTMRPARVTQNVAQQPKPPQREPYQSSLGDDMVMNGSIWNIGGPLPRHEASDPDAMHEGQQVLYETPPQPGMVAGAEEDEHVPSISDADATGEADDDGYGRALTKRRRMDGQSPLWPTSSTLNTNGKRPLAPQNTNAGRSVPRILKEQFTESSGSTARNGLP
ncbi:hypothetical protein HII31_08401 [Pseudocercospora fuligena]|uniref:Uncharacterized protein n=1 Tax=Pseudocercospora fuligena TaxID=685502 RepID=A0A8H6VKI3_9PEZI|nr:hypothetical protein HII31_08401 [Pseudocercospora fuligena]